MATTLISKRFRLTTLTHLFAALVVLYGTLAGAEMPPPGTTVTAENLDRYRDVLMPTADYFVRHGMTIPVIAYKRWEWPKAYREATEKFASQVVLTPDGRDIKNYVAGAPFPSIDTANDPLAGFKWIWNHEQNPIYSDTIGMGWNLELINQKGERERFFSSKFWRRMRWRGRLVRHDRLRLDGEAAAPAHSPPELRREEPFSFPPLIDQLEVPAHADVVAVDRILFVVPDPLEAGERIVRRIDLRKRRAGDVVLDVAAVRR